MEREGDGDSRKTVEIFQLFGATHWWKASLPEESDYPFTRGALGAGLVFVGDGADDGVSEVRFIRGVME